MTAKEIAEKDPMQLGQSAWLKEIAYQLAKLNEIDNKNDSQRHNQQRTKGR